MMDSHLMTSPAKRALLELLRAKRASTSPAPRTTPQVIPPHPPGIRLPLSPAQRRLWFLYRLDPEATVYNIQVSMRLSKPVSIPTLQQAIDALVYRHESLRTTFGEEDGQAFQSVLEHKPTLVVIDAGTGGNGVADQIDHWVKQPFDLTQPALFRPALFRVAPNDSTLVLAMHHIIADGWSMGILVRELMQLYQAFAQGQPSPLERLPIQYSDYIYWQHQHVDGTEKARLLDYWCSQLHGAPTLELPTDHPRPARQHFRGARHSARISAETTHSLRAMCEAQGVTPFMVILAGLYILLNRNGRADDICIGVPVAGRNRIELEPLVGFFLNTLVMRIRPHGDPEFHALLDQVRDVAVAAFAHQDLPFESLLEALQPRRRLDRTPLFQVFFNYLNYQAVDLSLDAGGPPHTGYDTEAQFDLALYAADAADTEEIVLTLVVDADLFDAATGQRWLSDLKTLLAAAIQNPERSVSTLPLISPAAFAASKVSPPTPEHPDGWDAAPARNTQGSLVQRFVACARSRPDAVAIEYDGLIWSYAELLHRASTIAHGLSTRNDARIALLLEHGPAAIAAMLGTLMAGRVYVPLDPEHPPSHARQRLIHAQTRLLLTESALARKADEIAAGQATVLVSEHLPPANEPFSPRSPNPDGMAYILYTSGSSGEPKGVVQSHRNVLGHIQAYSRVLQLTAADKLTLLPRYSTDAAVMDIYGALLNGAGLVMLDVYRSPASQLLNLLNRQAVTVLHTTPTIFRYLLGEASDTQRFPQMRWVVLGGEDARPSDVALSRRWFPSDCRFINGLGPTESTLALQYVIDAYTPLPPAVLPVGYPVAGCDARLLNNAGEEVGTLAEGQITLFSDRVALGYWQDRQATDHAFFDHPARGYRSGDLGRRLHNGAIVFSGRCDRQVEIRGNRVEPGEIETVLRRIAAITDAAVVVDEQERLLAYLATDHPIDAAALRDQLASSLPSHMIPSELITVPEFPRTVTGKVDRDRLPPLPGEPGGASHQRPLPGCEQQLAGFWSDLLGTDRIGRKDRFFDLGGHSLLALQLVSRIRTTFGVTLPLREIFEHPGLSEMAAIIERLRSETPVVDLSAIPRLASERYRLSPRPSPGEEDSE